MANSCPMGNPGATGHEGPETATPVSCDAGASLSGTEAQTFWAERRQRLQALTFETLPAVTTVMG